MYSGLGKDTLIGFWLKLVVGCLCVLWWGGTFSVLKKMIVSLGWFVTKCSVDATQQTDKLYFQMVTNLACRPASPSCHWSYVQIWHENVQWPWRSEMSNGGALTEAKAREMSLWRWDRSQHPVTMLWERHWNKQLRGISCQRKQDSKENSHLGVCLFGCF